MALDNFRKINITLNKANQHVLEPQIAKVGDVNGRELVVQLIDGGVIKDQTGVVLKLNWQHANGNQGSETFGTLDTKQGLFSVYYPENMLYRGTVTANISINENGKITHSLNFHINVQGDVFDGSAVEVDGALFTLKDLKNQINERNNSIDILENRQNSVENQFEILQQEITNKDVISAPEIIAARGDEPTLGARLDKTKPIKYLDGVPTTTDLKVGEIGVLVKEEVSLKVLNSFPKDGTDNVSVDSILYLDMNMPIDETTLTSNFVRLWDGETKIPLIINFDKVNNRIVIVPTPIGGRLTANTTYKLEITDSVRSTNNYRVGSGLYRVTFKTGNATTLAFNEPFTDYASNSNMTVTTVAPATITQQSGNALISTLTGGSVTIVGDVLTRNPPYTVKYRVKVLQASANSVLQLRMRVGARDFIVGLNGEGKAYDFRETNVINKSVYVDLDDFITVTISAERTDKCNAYVNGQKIPYLIGGSSTGSNFTLIANQPMQAEIHSIKTGLFYEVDGL